MKSYNTFLGRKSRTIINCGLSGLKVAHNPPISTTYVHHLAWRRESRCSVLPTLLLDQFRYNSSWTRFPTKRYGQCLHVSRLWCLGLSHRKSSFSVTLTTEKQRHMSSWEMLLYLKASLKKTSKTTGIGLSVVIWQTRKDEGESKCRGKKYFGKTLTLRWVNLCIWLSLIQMIWTQNTLYCFVLWIWVIVLSLFPPFSSFLSTWGKTKRKLLNQ